VSDQSTSEAEGAVMMDRFVTLTYHDLLPPNTIRFAEALYNGHILGQRCTVCSRVFVPPKEYCPLDVVVLGPEDDVEVADHGTVTGFTIVAPVRYYGQTKTEPFIYASVLLDGASGTIGGQNILGISPEDLRAGLRVKAVWKPADERTTEGQSIRGGGSIESCISAFEPSGEPDADRDSIREHLI
jgi:uncharacterized OB-fold protein